jgi:hypothetical protein
MNIEPLESRIAPASLTFSDVDGDNVKITTSGTGALTLGLNVLVVGGQLQILDLTSAAFQGASVKITATRDPVNGGDGFVNVGYINATGRDLGTVRVDGDLGAIDAGDPANPASACKRLTVHSLGRFGTATGASDLASDFDGRLDKLTVKSDVVEAFIHVTDSGGLNGRIGSVFIGGSLIGGALANSGSLLAAHGFGAVKIGGDIDGGDGLDSGSVSSNANIATVIVGGSLIGGTMLRSGHISSGGNIGSVKIAGDMAGGAGSFTGDIACGGTLASVTVGGSVRGGTGNNSGGVSSFLATGPVNIGHDLQGGAGSNSGSIQSGGKLASVSIGGSLIGSSGGNSGLILSSGDMGAVKIGHEMQGGSGFRSGLIATDGKLASVSIGGSLIGGSNDISGTIFSGDMGAVKIGHDVRGGSGSNSGSIQSGGKLASVSIGGSLIGGSNQESGAIFSLGNMGAVKIEHDVQGGSGYVSGSISSNGKLAGVNIGGSLIGGSDDNRTGEIYSTKAMGPVKIGQDIVGGSVSGSLTLAANGYISGQRIASLFVGGSIRAGVDDSSGTLTNSGSISAVDDIGPITIKGSLVGSIGTGGDVTLAVISARGQAGLSATAKTDVAIKSISIGGRVEFGRILAGYDVALQPVNGDAQIGTVIVGGDWIASRLAAGSNPGNDAIPGTNDDTLPGGGNPGIISRIASILIKGQAFGTLSGTDSFAFVAQRIGSLKVGATSFPLTSGADFEVIGSTGDLFVIDFL